MSTVASDTHAAASGESNLHDLQDRLEDLGFQSDLVDALDEALDEQTAFDSDDATLVVILKQILEDLAAYVHGQVGMWPQASAGSEQRATIHSHVFQILHTLDCPYASLMAQGPSCLSKRAGRMLALDFFLTELQAAKMIALANYKRAKAATPVTAGSTSSSVSAPAAAAPNVKKRSAAALATEPKRSKSEESKADTLALAALSIAPVPMEDIAEPVANDDDDEARNLAAEVNLLAHVLQVPLIAKDQSTMNGVTALRLVREYLATWLKASPNNALAVASSPIFSKDQFTPKQLQVLDDVYATFLQDYSLRLTVMRKRLEVTLQSFTWGGKGASCSDELARLGASRLSVFPHRAQVDAYELWCATPQVLSIARLTSRDYSLRSSIKRVIIGRVPDRGGRVDTNTRIEAEYGMPAFTKRVDDAGQGRRGGHGGHGGGYRGGKGRGR